MQTVIAPAKQGYDLPENVVATLRQIGVVGLPRNYEIFYEALSGSNPRLSLEVLALGEHPTQAQLDAISQKYFAQNHSQSVVEHAREIIARELEDVASILRKERGHLEKYGQILDQTSDGLNSRSSLTKDLLQKIANAMSSATAAKIDQGKQAANVLGEKSAELENLKSKLEEYKRLADTDPLTHIWNRRAFDKRIAELYNSNRAILFNALILADIDWFKDINDRHGHPAGDRILQIIADIFRSSTRDDMFVARTGGEEFALIVEGTTEQSTFELADNIRLLIEQTRFVSAQSGMDCGPVTISMGMCMASEANSADDLYAKADRALYRSKLDGRNRVTRFSSLPEVGGKNWLLYRKD
ncbi:GGDEF domain-containing protein [Pseudaminobacter arsenicus]|uniref:diguanylate cyclase n=1 Tax=Borborobacter arsenicus TaxID=1851146 RepID=A0A432V756_9HYPH|nr:GGDEF domain-containing protein [Pseudaminobacter arsenicus]RUM97985.1 GGDEF domain-containing protein [Pseudaminobacter arsenicus]